MAFNPNYKLIHTKTLLDGDEYCELAVRPTYKRERDGFSNGEKTENILILEMKKLDMNLS
ncbi:MAG: hypothetical protein KAV87_41750 [Desulfobacteraceae bacterium]|nr:hypothetical protein [Desulfobacteraceae bacterium]